jgi:hypothetical protein
VIAFALPDTPYLPLETSALGHKRTFHTLIRHVPLLGRNQTPLATRSADRPQTSMPVLQRPGDMSASGQSRTKRLRAKTFDLPLRADRDFRERQTSARKSRGASGAGHSMACFTDQLSSSAC